MKKIAVALCLLVAPLTSLAGTIYYVAPTGNDSNLGTSIDAPFLTIQRAASVAAAGDVCAIRGGTYRETVVPANSGTATAPILFTSYNGEKVVVSGADVISNWSLTSGNVYKADATLPVADSSDEDFFANQVFVDGVMVNQARWPNTGLDQLHPTDAVSITAPSWNSIADTDIPDLNWAGATIHIRSTNAWTDVSAKVDGYKDGAIHYNWISNPPSQAFVGPNLQYYLTGGGDGLKLLDAPGEWYYSDKDHALSLMTPQSDDPSSHVVEAKMRNYAFDLSGRSYIQLQNLSIFAASVLNDDSSSNNVLDHLNVKYVSHFMTINDNAHANPGCGIYCSHDDNTGIILAGSDHTVQNCTIAYSAGNGVVITGRNMTVTNNLIHDVDYLGTYCAAVRIARDGYGVITHNTLYNCGREGIINNVYSDRKKLRYAQKNTISYNNIYNVGLLTNDQGGIYFCCDTIDGMGSVIDHNWVHDNVAKKSEGIYIDNGASNFVVHHNVVWNVSEFDVFFNGGTSNHAYNNTLAGPAGSLEWNKPGNEAANNIYRGNGKDDDKNNNLPSKTDPRFVDSDKFDFHLQSGSPAIDAGKEIPDITDGFVGSSPDIGAYENGGPDWMPGCHLDSSGEAAETTAKFDPVKKLSTSDWYACVRSGGSLILDARPVEFYRQGHVPGAISFPAADFSAAYAKMKSKLEADKRQSIVVYCSDPSCPASEIVQMQLMERGFSRVARAPGGWAAWLAAKFPAEKSPAANAEASL